MEVLASGAAIPQYGEFARPVLAHNYRQSFFVLTLAALPTWGGGVNLSFLPSSQVIRAAYERFMIQARNVHPILCGSKINVTRQLQVLVVISASLPVYYIVVVAAQNSQELPWFAGQSVIFLPTPDN